MRRESSPSATYTRLPGRRFGLMQRATLWAAADHVLVVNETMTGEAYRRFFFRDIRAITIHPTGRRERTSLVLVVFALLNLVPLLFLMADDPDVRAVSLLAGGTLVWVALLVANLLRGPSCETRFSTAAHDDVVAPLSRLAPARRVVAMLRPRILAAQAELAPLSPATGDAAP
ncbi:MAG: hypothetical protein IAE82_11735 [Opitutaceae bacterium]|nr:hypothetical protein [Opitutaceae bacterium]